MDVRTDDLDTGSAPATGDRWTFDADVTAAFDDMLDRSIPNIEDMRRFVTDATAYFCRTTPLQRPLVIDLGASRGGALAPIVDRVGAKARYLACDVSEPMLDTLRERFSGWIDANQMTVQYHDLREGVPVSGVAPTAVILSILTLQFVPIEYRPRVLGSAYDQLVSGGALILVEKVMGQNALTDDLMRTLYQDLKRENGYSPEAIERKALSLEGVLVPLTGRFNEQMLLDAGFACAEQFWAWGPFRGWVAVKR